MLDVIDIAPVADVALKRRERGQRAFLSGEAAESSVVESYRARGAFLRHRRWRGKGGEMDLVLEQGGEIVFCEVKCAATHDAAMSRLLPAQVRRIMTAASEYMADLPDGQLSAVRFDLATVDRSGEVRILEAAFGHF